MTDTPTPDRPTETPAPKRSLRALWIAVGVLAVLLVAAVVVWIADGSGEGGSEEAAEPAPRIVSAAELSEAAAASGGPVYWAGERPGSELELSEVGEGRRVYVRYLTGGAEAGDAKPDFLTVGTYRLPVAFALLKASAKRSGAKLRKAPGGAQAWVDPASPTSVYLAKPGGEYQVEVYDPNPKTALEVALSPDLQPVPAG